MIGSRRHKKSFNAPVPKLNLVALMDIFTILVFFLMVNSSEVTVIPNQKQVTLPDSVANTYPTNELSILVTKSDVIVQGNSVVSIQQIDAELDDIPQLITSLNYHADRRKAELTEPLGPEGLPVMILGDAETPYELLKLVLASCASTDYRDVSLAVKRIARDSTTNQISSIDKSTNQS